MSTDTPKLNNNSVDNDSLMMKIKYGIRSEVKFFIYIALFLIGIVAPYYDIRQEIALIKQNHMSHIEAMQGQIKKLEEEQVRINQKIDSNQTQIINLLNNK